MSAATAPIRKLAAILFADIVGYTKWVHEDEARALERRRAVEQLIKAATTFQNGRVVKFLGDGAMLEFSSAVSAVSCALEIQSEVARLNKTTVATRPLQMRIGIHVGDVVEEGFDLYGTGVNIASRVQTMAPPGGICITREVYAQIKPILKLNCSKVSTLPEKDLPEPVDVFAVGEVIASETDSALNPELVANIKLFMVALVGWCVFFLAWNFGIAIHFATTALIFALLYLAAPRIVKGVKTPPRTRGDAIFYGVIMIMVVCAFAVGISTMFFGALDFLWEGHVGYKRPSAFYSDLKGNAEFIARVMPQLTAAGPIELRTPTVTRGFIIKNFTSLFDYRDWRWFLVHCAFSLFYIWFGLYLIFGMKPPPEQRRRINIGILMMILPGMFAAGLVRGLPTWMSEIANPAPGPEYRLRVSGKVSAHIVQQWARQTGLALDEHAIFPIHSISNRRKLGDFHIMEVREPDAYRRYHHTPDGMEMAYPRFIVRVVSAETDSYVQLDFGNQPFGKIPEPLARTLPLLEQRLKLYAASPPP